MLFPAQSSRRFILIEAAVLSAAFLGFTHAAHAHEPIKVPAPCVNVGGLSAPECHTDTVSMVIMGDAMMHTRQLNYDSRGFLRELEPLMKSADIAVVNAEFTMAGPPYQGYPRFSAPDTYAAVLRNAGADVLLLANNHVLDQGSKGLDRTISLIGGAFSGAGRDSVEYASSNPLLIHCRGTRIAIANFTYGTNMGGLSEWPRVSRLMQTEVAEQMARARKADFVIVLPHWGVEYELNHSDEQERWARLFVELGADAVIGSHPHVVQDTTHLGGVPVVYSVGNLVSNMSAKNTRLELAVLLRLVRELPFGTSRVLEPELHFLWCTLPGKLSDNYCTIEAKKFVDYREKWKDPADYDNMVQTLKRVKAETGIE